MSSIHTTILKYSHFFVVKNPTEKIIPLLYRLSSNYTQFGFEYDPRTRKQKWGPLKTYAIYVDHGREFRFHKGQWKDFEEMLTRSFIDTGSYTIEEIPDFEPAEIEVALRPKWVLRPDQEKGLAFVTEDDSRDNNSPLLLMPTGTGKSLLSMACVAKRGYRFAVVVVGGLVDKWVADICANLDLEPTDIGVIQGSDLLIRTTHYPESGKPIPKAFVISISTQAKWYKLYEECMDHPKLEAFACAVDEFCEHLGIGTVVFDEVHLHPHGVFRIHCYLHVPKTISLTATLLTKEQSLQKVQSMMFPRVQRFDTVKMKQYITAHACAFQIMNFVQSKILTTEHGRNTYSQAAFEKSILRHRRIAPQYVTMILDLIQTTYMDDMMPGDKVRIFVGTAKMANELMRATKARWPQYDTRTYLESDPYCNIIDSEIAFTTIIGAGAAIDIPLLRVVIMTNSIDSPNANVQILGRLRELKDRDTRFYYTYCTTIPKHVDYHNNKIDIFKNRVIAQKQLFVGTLYP